MALKMLVKATKFGAEGVKHMVKAMKWQFQLAKEYFPDNPPLRRHHIVTLIVTGVILFLIHRRAVSGPAVIHNGSASDGGSAELTQQAAGIPSTPDVNSTYIQTNDDDDLSTLHDDSVVSNEAVFDADHGDEEKSETRSYVGNEQIPNNQDSLQSGHFLRNYIEADGVRPEASISSRVLYTNEDLAKLREKLVQVKPLKILMWESAHASELNSQLERGCKGLPSGQQCIYTADSQEYNTSEAVGISLLHSARSLPPFRLPFQKWIYMEGEPPANVWLRNTALMENVTSYYGDQFNITSTRNKDADIIPSALYSVCTIDQQKLQTFEDENIDYAANKSGKVAWFVSHCTTQSKREEYVKELAKFIDVDIYGKCGTMKCADSAHRTECDMSLLHRKYKFYLSFENSICEDYVTEKLTRFIEVPVATIPVVLGGADYGKMLQPYTYIDVKDFSSPRALADYLRVIDENASLFNMYIRRKNSLTCEKYPHLETFGCRVCQFLHEHRSQVDVAPDIRSYYGIEQRCVRPKDFLKGVEFSPDSY